MARSGAYAVISAPHTGQFFQQSQTAKSPFRSERRAFPHWLHLPSYFAMVRFRLLYQVNVVAMLVIFAMALLLRTPTPKRVVARTPYLPFLMSSQSSTVMSRLSSITDATRVSMA